MAIPALCRWFFILLCGGSPCWIRSDSFLGGKEGLFRVGAIAKPGCVLSDESNTLRPPKQKADEANIQLFPVAMAPGILGRRRWPQGRSGHHRHDFCAVAFDTVSMRFIRSITTVLLDISTGVRLTGLIHANDSPSQQLFGHLHLQVQEQRLL